MVLQHSKVLSGILSVYKYSILCKVSLHLQSNQPQRTSFVHKGAQRSTKDNKGHFNQHKDLHIKFQVQK
jgi:hypothetical protein